MTKPSAKYIWIIFDALDGPHVFRSMKAALKEYGCWNRQAVKRGDTYDSFWDMSEPVRYERSVDNE